MIRGEAIILRGLSNNIKRFPPACYAAVLSDLPPTTRTRWSLTQQAFDALLQRLDPDREKAGAKFEALRHKLLQFFSYETCSLPDHWADETLDRVAKRLSEGSLVEDLNVFTRGVARMVLREARLAETRTNNLKHLPVLDTALNEDAAENAAENDEACLEDCLSKLPTATQHLVQNYYLGSTASRIAARKAIAERMGITMEALRSRALRARRQLEICLQDCRKKHKTSGIKTQFSSDNNRR